MAQVFTNTLPPPGKVLDDANMRVQEKIHGHRLIPEQEPFMVLLETLAVCAAHPLGSVKPVAGQHESFSYDLPHHRKMRFLLFVDRNLDQVVKDATIPDSEKWSAWKERVNVRFEPEAADGVDEFAYLDEAFDRNIYDLQQAVAILRSRELDVMNNRRWTSRFLAVTGPSMICTDMREKAGQNWASDRRFFGRGGELVYLMLNRSKNATEIGARIRERLLNETDPINELARKLCDPLDTSKSSTKIGYLPLQDHPAYDRMGEDWLSILTLPRLPDAHVFEPLFRIMGLNLVVYLSERAHEVAGGPRPDPILVDLTDGEETPLRNQAKAQLNLHRHSANRAVRSYVQGLAEADEGWCTAVAEGNSQAAKEVIKRLFHFDADGAQAPAAQLSELISQAEKRDKNNAHRTLLPLLKYSGLSTSRPRVGTWFALEDATITALVLANVTHTVELRDFVARLYDRYGLVIGPEQARQAYSHPPVGAQSFETNLATLEARMTRLSLTKRLSDDCAFVTNPFHQEKS